MPGDPVTHRALPWKTHGLGLEEPGGGEGKVRAEDLRRIWGGEEPNAALSQGFWHRETFPEDQTVGVGWGRSIPSSAQPCGHHSSSPKRGKREAQALSRCPQDLPAAAWPLGVAPPGVCTEGKQGHAPPVAATSARGHRGRRSEVPPLRRDPRGSGGAARSPSEPEPTSAAGG